MANKPADPIAGKVGVMQTGAPQDAANYAKPGQIVVFQPGVSQQQVDQARAAGATVMLWDPRASAATAAEAQRLGVDGLIVELEGPGQEAGANAAIAGMQGSGIPVGIVTNNYSSSYPSGISFVVGESYTGSNAQATPGSVISDIRNRGWSGPAYVVIGGDVANPDQAAAAAAFGGYLVFPPHIGNTDETNSMITTPKSPAAIIGLPAGQPAPATAPGTPTAGSSGTSSSAPAWHTNANWHAPTADETAWISNRPNFDASQVLEVRPAEDGSGGLILRMSDGTYLEINRGNTATPIVGNWDNTQWNQSQVGQASGVAINPNTSTSTSGTSSGAITSESTDTPATSAIIDHTLKSFGSGDNALKSAIVNHGSNSLSSSPTLKDSGSGFSATHHGGTGSASAVVDAMASGSLPDSPVEHVGLPASMVGAPPSCFIAGSKVSTPDGDKAIEEIKLGDMVLTWNMEKNATEPTQVTDTLAHHDRHTIVVETEDGKKLTTTVEHPFWTGGEWLPAGHLKANESSVFNSEGQQKRVTAVTDGPKANVYNFHVTAPAHNYFVEGILVHNLKAAGM